MATKTPIRKAKAASPTNPAKPSARPAAKRPVRAIRKPAAPKAATAPSGATSSKQSQLIALLRSAPGGTLAQMTKLTGWQPHSIRGVISGVLRKKLGLQVTSAAGESGTRVYRIVAA